jgi:WD repeat-containing protein 35
MFAFLQKKIAIPAQSQVTACNWGKEDGWLAIGGSMGLLKVIKLDDGKPKGDQAGQLAENSALESHSGTFGVYVGNVNIICWNEKYRKLTTGDSNGLIIVYMRHKGEWF